MIARARSRHLRLTLPLITILVYAALSAALAIRSDGVCINDDLCHFQIARSAWRDRGMLVNTWGRPGFTLPQALVANIGSTAAGFRACRLLNSAMASLTVLLAWLTARRMRAPGAWGVPVLLLLMPEGFAQSFTTCTEVPAGLYAMGGTYLLAIGRRRWAAVVFALLPATRHELAAFLVPLGLYFLWRRDVLAALLLGWFELAWNIASWRIGMGVVILRYVTPQDSTLYGSGHLLHFMFNWMKMAGVVIAALTMAGAWLITIREGRRRQWGRRDEAGRRARLRLMSVGAAIGLVVLETLLYTFNGFASGGYSKFLVPGAPFMAICACFGIYWLLHLTERRGPMALAGVALLTTVAVAQWGAFVRPYRLGAHEARLGEAITRLRFEHPTCHVVSHSPWAAYFDEPGLDVPGVAALDLWREGKLAEMYYVYDDAPGFGPPLEKVMAAPTELVRTVEGADGKADVWILRRR